MRRITDDIMIGVMTLVEAMAIIIIMINYNNTTLIKELIGKRSKSLSWLRITQCNSEELRITQCKNEKYNSKWYNDNSEIQYLVMERTVASDISDNIEWYNGKGNAF